MPETSATAGYRKSIRISGTSGKRASYLYLPDFQKTKQNDFNLCI